VSDVLPTVGAIAWVAFGLARWMSVIEHGGHWSPRKFGVALLLGPFALLLGE
jgi:hypothetical protein